MPGEYAVVLLPSLKAFNAYNEQRFPPHRILRLRVMCMYVTPHFLCSRPPCNAFARRYLPLFMPHVDDMQHFSLIGQVTQPPPALCCCLHAAPGLLRRRLPCAVSQAHALPRFQPRVAATKP